MVRGCWGIRHDTRPATSQGWAGGNNDALNSRDRYIKANSNKGVPFGVDQSDSSQGWATSSKQTYRPVSAIEAQQQRIAGAPSRQQMYVQQYSSRSSNVGSDEEILEKFREKLRQRGARGIIGLRRVFKIIDDSSNGKLEL
jgi:hypothetical protein